MKIFGTIIEMGESLEKRDDTLCLLGLGSIYDQARLDEYSDIDFFLIVKDGYKKSFLDDLSWMNRRIIYSFKNTIDGYKVLFDNDVFAEFAVFELSELNRISFDEGNIIFAKPEFNLDLIKSKKKHNKSLDVEFNINEAMTNLYIGLLRDKRGEKASAFTFIQVYAVNLIMPLFELLYQENKVSIDSYSYERRIEFRFNEAFDILKTFKQGYLRNTESAKAILDFLNTNFNINQILYKRISSLVQP